MSKTEYLDFLATCEISWKNSRKNRKEKRREEEEGNGGNVSVSVAVQDVGKDNNVDKGP